MGLKLSGKPIRTGSYERHATWLELFYDLVYVVVIDALVHRITDVDGAHLGLARYLAFAALFVPVWWAWTGHTLFQNRFDPDDLPHRLLTLLQMLAASFMAIFATDALDAGANGFALSYVVVRALLLAMYWRVHERGGAYADVTSLLLTGFSLGAALWLVSIAVPSPYKFAFWAAGIAVDMATPWIGAKRLARVSVHATHLPEHLGLLTIIVLGESVLSIVGGVETSSFGWAVLVPVLFGFLLLGAIWWLYFECLEASLLGAKYTNGQLAIYGHLPVYMGLVTLAAGIRYAINGELAGEETIWLLCGGLLLFMVPLEVIHGARLGGERLRRYAAASLLLDAGLAATGIVAAGLVPSLQLVLVATLYTAYVIIESSSVTPGVGR